MPTDLTPEQLDVIRKHRQLADQTRQPPPADQSELPKLAPRNAPRQGLGVAQPTFQADRRGQQPAPRAPSRLPGMLGEAADIGMEIVGSEAARRAAVARLLPALEQAATKPLPPLAQALIRLGMGTIGAVAGAMPGIATREVLQPGEFLLTPEMLRNRTLEAAFSEIAGEGVSLGWQGVKRVVKGTPRAVLGRPSVEAEELFRRSRKLAKLPAISRTPETALLDNVPLTLAERLDGGLVSGLARLSEDATTGFRLRKLLGSRDIGTIQSVEGMLDVLRADMTSDEAAELALNLAMDDKKSQQLLTSLFWQPLDREGTSIFVRVGEGKKYAREELRLLGESIEAGADVSGRPVLEQMATKHARGYRKLERRVRDELAEGFARKGIEPPSAEAFEEAVQAELENWMTLSGAISSLKHINTMGEQASRLAKSSPGLRQGVKVKAMLERAITKTLKEEGRDDLMGWWQAGRKLASLTKKVYENDVSRTFLQHGVEKTAKQPDELLPMIWRYGYGRTQIILDTVKSEPALHTKRLLARLERSGIEITAAHKKRFERELARLENRSVDKALALRALRAGYGIKLLNDALVEGITKKPEARVDVDKLTKLLGDRGQGVRKAKLMLTKPVYDNFILVREMLERQQMEKGPRGFSIWIRLKEAEVMGRGTETLIGLATLGSFATGYQGVGALGTAVFAIPYGLSRLLESREWTERFIRWAKKANEIGAPKSSAFARHTVRFLDFSKRIAEQKRAEDQDLAGTSHYFPLPEQRTATSQAPPSGPLLPRESAPAAQPMDERLEPEQIEALRKIAPPIFRGQ